MEINFRMEIMGKVTLKLKQGIDIDFRELMKY